MGWLDRVLRWSGDELEVGASAGMEFRTDVMRRGPDEERRRQLDAEIATRINSTWLWTGDRWQKWSTVWKTYDDVDQTIVPTPLLDLLGAQGITPAAGDRFRFVDGAWLALDPGVPDQLPDDPDDADRDGPVEDPWRSD